MSRVKIPKLVGLSWPQAQRTATAAGFKLQPKMVSDRDRPRLEVLWQRTLWAPEFAESEVRGLELSESELLESEAFGSDSLGFESLASGSLGRGSQESGSLQSGSLQSGSLKSGSLELESLEAGSLENSSPERPESLKAGSLEARSQESGSLESGSLVSDSSDSGSLDSSSLQSGPLASKSLVSGSLVSGPLDSESPEPGPLISRYLDSKPLELGSLAFGSHDPKVPSSESQKSKTTVKGPKDEAVEGWHQVRPETALPILEVGIAVPSWLRHLPEIFIENDQQNGDFLKRLLELLAHLLLPVEKQMAGVAFSLNPRLAAPSELLQLLAWFAPTERGLQGHGQQRDFLCRLPQLWGQLGTVQGLKLALHLWLGLEVGIVEKPPPLSNAGLGSHFRIGIHGAFGPAIPSWQWFIVTIPTQLKKTQLSIAHRIVSSYAPAHGHWTLCCTQKMSRRPRLPRGFRLGRDQIAEVGGGRIFHSGSEEEKPKTALSENSSPTLSGG